MRKMLASAAAVIVLATLAMSVAAQPKYVLRFSSPNSKEHAWGRSAEKFKQLVAEETKGQVEVQVYHSNALGATRESLEMTRLGSTDFVLCGVAHVSRFVPEMGAFVLPYLWKDTETMFKALDGRMGDTVARRVRDVEPETRRASERRRAHIRGRDARAKQARGDELGGLRQRHRRAKARPLLLVGAAGHHRLAVRDALEEAQALERVAVDRPRLDLAGGCRRPRDARLDAVESVDRSRARLDERIRLRRARGQGDPEGDAGHATAQPAHHRSRSAICALIISRSSAPGRCSR